MCLYLGVHSRHWSSTTSFRVCTTLSTLCSWFISCVFTLPTFLPQHASADVERMVLGNKCDVNDKRQVSKDRGEKVINLIMHAVRTWFKKYTRISLCCGADTDSVSFLLPSAGAGVRYQIHGDQCKGEHQRGEREFHVFQRLLVYNFSSS